MNAINFTSFTNFSRRSTDRKPAASAHPVAARRPRDFGIGYGNSSGYASNRRYASDWGMPRFRCA